MSNTLAKKQTMTIHAKNEDDLNEMVEYLSILFQENVDGGNAPEQVFFELGSIEDSDADFE